MKKILFILSLLALPTSAIFAQSFTVGGISYEVTSIENKTVETYGYAYDHEALTEINVPEMVEYEGDIYTVTGIGTWFTTDNIQIVHIPKTITYIKDKAFHHRNGLKEIHITDLGAWANINFLGDLAYSQPLGFWNIGHRTRLYLNDELLDSIDIPDGTTKINNAAFYGCEWAKRVSLPEGLMTIGKSSFYRCWGVKTLTIPQSITHIDDFAFYECNYLDSVIVKSPNPISISDGDLLNTGKQFDEETYARATLYVPEGSVIAYATTEGWTKFKHIEVLKNSAGIRSTRSDVTGGKAYRLDGTPATESDKGIIIQDGKKSIQK